jgi:endo-1,4-beta-xylanase
VTSPKYINDLPPAEFVKVVRNHIFTVMRHFKGRVRQWDVVNEALAPDGSMADTVFLRKMGPNYISQCFRWAHEADPEAFLIYNDNKVESWGLGSPHSDKAEGYFNLLKGLVDEGVPVHGAGMQGHFVGEHEPSHSRKIIRTLTQPFVRLVSLAARCSLQLRALGSAGRQLRQLWRIRSAAFPLSTSR